MIYRSLCIPNTLVPAVTGCLLQLCEMWNWEKFGELTVDETVALATELLECYWSINKMIGSVVAYAGATIPDNMLLCDGTQYARADYPDLYAALASCYVIDADYFTAPDLGGVFVMGTDTNEGETGGSATHTLTTDEMPSHHHVYQEKNEILFPYGAFTPDISARGTLLESDKNTSAVGGGEAHNNLPPYHAMQWCIICR